MKAFKKSRYNIIFSHDNARYLFNTFTGSFQPLSDNLYRLYNRWGQVNPGIHAEEDGIHHLVNMGALVEEGFDELAFLKKIRYRENSMEAITQLAFWLMTTERCNFRCFYCFEDREKRRDISYTGNDFISFLEKFPALNRINMTWFGGEPLLNMSPIKELTGKAYDYSREKGIFYHAGMITNGFLLTPAIVKRLKEWHITFVQITLDGPPDIYEQYKSVQGAFRTVLDNLYHLAEDREVFLRINLDKNNTRTMPELFNIMAARGFRNISINFAPITESVPDGEAFSPWTASCFTSEEFGAAEKELYDILYNLGYEKWQLPEKGARIAFCGGASSHFYTVGVTGVLYRCSHLCGGQHEIAGSVQEGILPEAFTHAWLKEYRSLPSSCDACDFLPQCQGGCPYSREHQSSQGENCISSRYNLIGRLTSMLTQAKRHNRDIFVHRSTQEQVDLLTRMSRGAVLNRHDLKTAALAGGGLGMLLARAGE
ncbi:radical SAM/SPASM domain-containing protein [Candidatus Formimonas warabiya]|uniref:Radical SAM core domain-containing protein n=1 Tax=Formimonas warabiya TaxID=1761012 RepID=A0A3G1KZK8_FORW1|nr:radical SAM protein [Candidatus Formimonas warabiya]ATW27847.1 hypothetical protein DCMF_26595 [Candidatus Formimonas warabiya]